MPSPPIENSAEDSSVSPIRANRVAQGPDPRSRRSGKALLRWLLVLLFLTGSIVGVWYAVRQVEWTDKETGPIMHVVKRGEFVHEITEQGEVESTNNVEIRCEVRARGSQGAKILWIIPEGTNVEKDQKLIEFDKSAFESELTQKQISYNNSVAAFTKAENDRDNAVKDLEEYEKGTYLLEKMKIEIKEFTAKIEQGDAQQTLEYKEELEQKGYVQVLQVKKAEDAKEKADRNLKSAELEMTVLKEYTRPKMLKKLDSAIKTAKANLESAKAKQALDLSELERVRTQVEKCTVYAKETGQVVYVNESRWGDSIIIEEGALIREQQTVIRLPDPQRMQVEAKINESKVTAVQAGQPVQIALDAMPDVSLQGTVDRVDEYPTSEGFWSRGGIKKYNTYIKIVDSSVPLKPGLTAEVRIEIERIPDCIQVPVQAVFEHGEKYYCIKRGPKGSKGWIAHEVQVGSTNDKSIVITSGLEPGESIVHGAFAYRKKVDLPKLSPELENAKKKNGRGGTKSTTKKDPKKSPPKDPFATMDKDKNGRISKSELPAQMQPLLSKVDLNGDNEIDKSEWAKIKAAMPKDRKPPSGAPGPARGHGQGPAQHRGGR